MDGQMELWLSRQANGSYMLTDKKPVIGEVGTTGYRDLYVAVGDSVGIRHMCPRGAQGLFGVKLRRLESVRVELSGRVAAKE